MTRRSLLAGALALACSAQSGCSATADSNAGDAAPAPGDLGTPAQPAPDGGGPASAPFAAPPVFGPNVLVFDPSMPMSAIQSRLDALYAQQDAAQFGAGRYAYLFKPGHYALDVKVGFYTQVLGLGASPDDVVITGAVRSKADWLGNNNATCNFWRGAENLAVVPSAAIDAGIDVWAVSQGTQLRRVHVEGDLKLDDGGWSSGGFIADSIVDGTLTSGSQQQFLTRNDDQRWQGSNWNMVFVGDTNAPQPSWPNPPFTVAATTPLVREKPYLTIDSANHYSVVVPPLKTNSQGTDWTTAGTSVSIDHFHIANPNVDTVATLNAALAQGKHLLFTPGVYHLNGTLRITQPGTIVLGLGLATLIADNGVALISIDDIDDATIAGLLLEAGPQSSNTLLEVGAPGSSLDHSANPTVLFDVHCRVGGAGVGTAASCVTINSNHVLGDNLWLWRADHGAGADWNTNKSDHGLIVNGHDVTIYGLFVEHFQKYQTLWNGDRGTVYFYQSEMPYDPPNQTAWQESAGKNGYPSYKVADGVQTHHAMGIGVYGVFNNDVTADNAIETPINAGTVLNHLVTVSLASGAIAHIINGTGGAVGHGTMTAFSGD